MPVFDLPTSTTDPNYSIEVTLDGRVFRLLFKFNGRDQAWYLDLFDADDVLLRSGIRIVNDWLLFRLWQTETRPEGDSMAIAQGADTSIAGLQDLGERVLLTYIGES